MVRASVRLAAMWTVVQELRSRQYLGIGEWNVYAAACQIA